MKSRKSNAAAVIMAAVLGWTQAQWNIMSQARSFERVHRKSSKRNGPTRKENLVKVSSNPLRGYYNRYSHVLTEIQTEVNKSLAPRESKFLGFRTKRIAIVDPDTGRFLHTIWG